MIKKLLLLVIGLYSIHNNSQQIEIGPNAGFSLVNIIGVSDFSDENIGLGIVRGHFGLTAAYNFKNPKNQFTGRIGLLYKNTKKGSQSPIYDDSLFEFSSNTLGIFGGLAYGTMNGFIFALDAGIGFNSLNNINFYRGNTSQQDAFPYLIENLELKSNETTLFLSTSLQKELIQNRLKIVLDVFVDLGIPNISRNHDSFYTLSFGIGTGLRYVFDLGKKQK